MTIALRPPSERVKQIVRQYVEVQGEQIERFAREYGLMFQGAEDEISTIVKARALAGDQAAGAQLDPSKPCEERDSSEPELELPFVLSEKQVDPYRFGEGVDELSICAFQQFLTQFNQMGDLDQMALIKHYEKVEPKTAAIDSGMVKHFLGFLFDQKRANVLFELSKLRPGAAPLVVFCLGLCGAIECSVEFLGFCFSGQRDIAALLPRLGPIDLGVLETAICTFKIENHAAARGVVATFVTRCHNIADMERLCMRLSTLEPQTYFGYSALADSLLVMGLCRLRIPLDVALKALGHFRALYEIRACPGCAQAYYLRCLRCSGHATLPFVVPQVYARLKALAGFPLAQELGSWESRTCRAALVDQEAFGAALVAHLYLSEAQVEARLLEEALTRPGRLPSAHRRAAAEFLLAKGDGRVVYLLEGAALGLQETVLRAASQSLGLDPEEGLYLLAFLASRSGFDSRGLRKLAPSVVRRCLEEAGAARNQEALYLARQILAMEVLDEPRKPAQSDSAPEERLVDEEEFLAFLTGESARSSSALGAFLWGLLAHQQGWALSSSKAFWVNAVRFLQAAVLLSQLAAVTGALELFGGPDSRRLSGLLSTLVAGCRSPAVARVLVEFSQAECLSLDAPAHQRLLGFADPQLVREGARGLRGSAALGAKIRAWEARLGEVRGEVERALVTAAADGFFGTGPQETQGVAARRLSDFLSAELVSLKSCQTTSEYNARMAQLCQRCRAAAESFGADPGVHLNGIVLKLMERLVVNGIVLPQMPVQLAIRNLLAQKDPQPAAGLLRACVERFGARSCAAHFKGALQSLKSVRVGDTSYMNVQLVFRALCAEETSFLVLLRQLAVVLLRDNRAYFQYLCCFLPLEHFTTQTKAALELLEELGLDEFAAQLNDILQAGPGRVRMAIELAQNQ